MANNKIYVKRTSTSGNKPTTAQIANGELAVNMTDGILYSTNGSVVFEIGANVTSSMIGNTTANITGNTTMLRIANSTSSSNLTPVSLISGISIVNTTQISVGSNNFMNATALDIGNTVITTTNTILGGTLAANGGIGSAGQVLTSGGAGNVYWTTPQIGDITAVTAGNGLTGGGTTGDVTLDVGAANGITVSADAVGAVVGSTQTLNSTGIHVNTNLSITTLTTTGNITLGNALSANGSTGTAGFVLKSGGSANAYWAADTDTNTTYDLLAIANTTTNQGIVRLKDVNNSNDDVLFTGTGSIVVSSNATHVILNGTDNNTTYDLLAIANTEANAGRLRLKDVNNSNDDVIISGANGIIVSSNATHIIVTDTLSGDITSVTAGNGLTGGGTGGDVSLAVQAGTDGGLISNSTGVWVLAGNGLLTNSTGVHVGAANGITVTADAVGALVGSTQTLNTTGIHVNTNLSITTLTTSGNITLGNALSANGSTGTAGFVLKSGGTANAYWAADTDTNTTYDLLTIANTTTNQGIVRLKDVNNSNDDIQFTGANGVFVSSNATHVLITGQINTDTDTNTTYDLLAIANTEANAGRLRLKDVNNSNDDVIISGANGIIVSSNATHIIVTDTLSGDITSVTAGNGLTGGGTGGDVTLDVGAANGITVSADAVGAVVGPTQTLNSTGIHVNTNLSITTLTTSGNITLGASFSANGGFGSAGQVLKSGGSGANAYWAADTDTNTTYDLLAIANTEANAGRLRLKDVNNSNDDVIISGANGIVVSSNATHIIVTDTLSGDITSVTAGNGLSGGGTGGDVSLAVVAGTDAGLVSNSTGVFITAGNGLLTNSTGLHVGSANGITVAADTVGALVGSTQTLNSTGIHVNTNLSITTLTTTGNITLGAAFSANGSTGTAGFVLKSGGTANAYWAADTDTNTTYDLLTIANTTTNQGIVRLKDVNNSNDDIQFTGANGVVVSSNATHVLITGQINTDTDTNTTYDLLAIANTEANAGRIRLKDSNNSNDDVIVSGANGIAVSSNATHVIATISSITAPGTDTQVIFNDGGSLNGDAGFTYNKTTDTFNVSNATSNLIATPATLSIQNTTVNAVIGLQSLTIQTNTTVNSSISNTLVQVANASGNVQHTATSILAQTNTTVNSTMTASTLQVANSTGNVQHTATSILAQTNSTVNATMTAALVQVANSTGSANLTATSLVIGNSTIQTTNAIFGGTIAVNGSIGTAGFVLKSAGAGANAYWAADLNSGGTVTSVGSGNGLTGGPITTSGSLAVQAGTDGGLVSNSTGVFITAGNGLVTNSTGLHVAAANGITIAADTVGALVGSTQTLNSTGIHVNSTLSITTLTTTGNITLGASFSANGGFGSAGQVLKSGGSGANAYWAADIDTNTTYDLLAVANTTTNQGIIRLRDSSTANDDVIVTGAGGIVVSSNATHIIITDSIAGDITGVAAGNGLTGGGTSGDVTLDVGAGNGITVAADSIAVTEGVGLAVNSTGVHVKANTGIIANTTGTFVNAAYIATIAANSATGSLTNTFTVGTASYFVANGNLGVGTSTPGYRLEVNGSFAATTKSFIIDHPTKSDMKLRYGSLEGPENGVYVRGRTNTNTIELPDYWTGLIDQDSISVNLTAIGRKQELYVKEIANNRITIAGSRNIDCYYTVFAERKDVVKLVVEF